MDHGNVNALWEEMIASNERLASVLDRLSRLQEEMVDQLNGMTGLTERLAKYYEEKRRVSSRTPASGLISGVPKNDLYAVDRDVSGDSGDRYRLDEGDLGGTQSGNC